MLALQKIVQELAPKREAGPFDEVAKALMLRATETVVPEVAPALRANDGGGWIKDLITSLAPQLPNLLTGINNFVAQQHRLSIERLNHEARLRSQLIAQQRGAAPPAELAQEQIPAAAAPSPEEQAQLALQQQEQARQAAQMELFIDALTTTFFGGDDPEDAAITLLTGFPQIVQGLKTQLAPYGNWWENQQVMGFLRQTYPAMRPVLNRPEFGAWIARVWAELAAPVEEEEGAETPAQEAAPAVPKI